MLCSGPSLGVDLQQPLGTYAEQLDYLIGARVFPRAIMGDERIRTLGDAWQHAIGNVIAGPAYCPAG
jgi:hypothetical protein